MTDRTDPTPVALYARVSSDRQDIDLSVAVQRGGVTRACRLGGRRRPGCVGRRSRDRTGLRNRPLQSAL